MVTVLIVIEKGQNFGHIGPVYYKKKKKKTSLGIAREIQKIIFLKIVAAFDTIYNIIQIRAEPCEHNFIAIETLTIVVIYKAMANRLWIKTSMLSN